MAKSKAATNLLLLVPGAHLKRIKKAGTLGRTTQKSQYRRTTTQGQLSRRSFAGHSECMYNPPEDSREALHVAMTTRVLRFTSVLCISSFLLLGIGGLAAQEAETRTIPLIVYDSKGKFVLGLKPENFSVKEPKAKVLSIRPDGSARRILLLIDGTGRQVAEETVVRKEQTSLIVSEILKALQKDDQVSLHVYAREYRVLVPYTNDFASVTQALDAYFATDSEQRAESPRDLGLGDALARLLELRGSDARFGDSLVLITRGEYYGPSPRRVQPEDMRRALIASGLRFFLVRNPLVFGPAGARAVEGLLIFRSQVKDLPGDTGGAIFDPAEVAETTHQKYAFRIDPQVIRDTLRGLYPLIRYVYRVDLQFEGPIIAERKLVIEFPRGSPQGVGGSIYPRYLAPVSRH